MLQLPGIAGGGKAGELREQRGGDRDHKHRGHKPGDAVAVIQHRDHALRKQRGDALINDDIDGIDGLAQEDRQNHHQEFTDIMVAEGDIRVVAELPPQRHQQHQQELPCVADDNAPAQHIVVLSGKENGGDDRDVQRHAHHANGKEAALHLQVALQNIADPQEHQRGDHDGGKVHRQVQLRALKAQREQPHNGIPQRQKHSDKAHREQKRHGDHLVVERLFLTGAVLLQVGINADIAGQHSGTQPGKENGGQGERHHIGVTYIAGTVRKGQRKLPAEAEHLGQYRGQHHDDGMDSGLVHLLIAPLRNVINAALLQLAKITEREKGEDRPSLDGLARNIGVLPVTAIHGIGPVIAHKEVIPLRDIKLTGNGILVHHIAFLLHFPINGHSAVFIDLHMVARQPDEPLDECGAGQLRGLRRKDDDIPALQLFQVMHPQREKRAVLGNGRLHAARGHNRHKEHKFHDQKQCQNLQPKGQDPLLIQPLKGHGLLFFLWGIFRFFFAGGRGGILRLAGILYDIGHAISSQCFFTSVFPSGSSLRRSPP